MRRPRALCPQAIAVLILTALCYVSSKSKSYLVCKQPGAQICQTWIVNAKNVQPNFKETFTIANSLATCAVMEALHISNARTLISGDPVSQNQPKTSTYCESFKIIGDFHDWKGVFIAMGKAVRVRRQSDYTPRGRYRGQTQSQYLTIDQGNNKDVGKAEAHSAADSSRASVSGNSGMGQAQSQSVYDPSCDDCYGKSDKGADNLKRVSYFPDLHRGTGDRANQPNWRDGVKDNGLSPNGDAGGGRRPGKSGLIDYIPGQTYGTNQGPGSLGTESAPSSSYVPVNQNIGPANNLVENYRPGGNHNKPGSILPNQVGLPTGQSFNGDFGPERNGQGIPPGGQTYGSEGVLDPNRHNKELTPDGRGGFTPGKGVDESYGPAQSGFKPDYTGGFTPTDGRNVGGNNNIGPSRSGGGNDYGPNQLFNPNNQLSGNGQGKPSDVNRGYFPGQTGFEKVNPYSYSGRRKEEYGPGVSGSNVLPNPGGEFIPGPTGLNGGYPVNKIGTSGQGKQGNIPGLQTGSTGSNQLGSPGTNWPLASGPYPGPGGSNVYCCVVPNNGQNINTYPNSYGTGNNNGIPSISAGYQVPNNLLNPGKYGPDTTGILRHPDGQYLGPGDQYTPGSLGGQNIPGDSREKYVPGGVGGQYTPGNSGGQNIPRESGGQYIPVGSRGQYSPGDLGGQNIHGVSGGQYSPRGLGGKYSPGSSGGQNVPGGSGVQYSPGGLGGQNVPGGSGGQYSPGGSVGQNIPGGSSVQYSPGGSGGQNIPGGTVYIPGGSGGQNIPVDSGGQYSPSGSGGQNVPGGLGGQYNPGGSGGQNVPGGPGGQYNPGGSGGQNVPGGLGVQNIPGGLGGQYSPGGSVGQNIPGGSGIQYSPGGSGGQNIPGNTGGLYSPGGSGGQNIPGGSGGQYNPGGSERQNIPGGPGGQYSHGGSGGQNIPVGPGGQYSPGSSGGRSIPGGFSGQNIPDGTGRQYSPGGSGGQYIPLGSEGQYSPGSSGGQLSPGITGEKNIPVGSGGQHIPGGSEGQYIPVASGGQHIPDRSGGQYIPVGSSGQYSPGDSGGQNIPGGSGGKYSPGGSGGQIIPGGTGGQYSPGGSGGQNSPSGTGGLYSPSGSGGQNIPNGSGGQNIPGGQDGQYSPGGSGQNFPGGSGGQYSPGGPGGQPIPGDSYGPGLTNQPYGTGKVGPTGAQYGPENGGTQYGLTAPGKTVGGPGTSVTEGQYTPGTTGGTYYEKPPGQYGIGTNGGPQDGQYDTGEPKSSSGTYGTGSNGNLPEGAGPNQGNYDGVNGNAQTPGSNGYYPSGQVGGAGGQQPYGPGYYQPGGAAAGQSGRGPYGYDNQGAAGLNKDNDIPQNYVSPNSFAPDDDDSEAEASVAQAANGTTASASSKGGNSKERAQANVHGTYTGSGSFQAQAQITGDNKGAESEVSGGKKGASSSASGNGRNNKSQANVQLGSETGSVQTQSQSNGVMHSSNSQVQGSVKGGMADAQARGPGSTSSQAQIGFTPYKDRDKPAHDSQGTPFVGGGLASAQSSGRTGQSQSQLHGTFRYGITYNGAAQSGASLDKDAVFPNRLSFDKIDVFDDDEKLINTTNITDEPEPLESYSTPKASSTFPVPFETKLIDPVTTENIVDETVNDLESKYSSHTHSDHHKSDETDITSVPPVLSNKSFLTPNYAPNNVDYDFTTDKDDNQPEDYDTDAGYGPEGNEAIVEQGEYSNNYDDYTKDPQTHQSLQSPSHKGIEIKQTSGGNTQHILLDSLTNQDAQITQRNSERPDEGRIYQPGERVPGIGGYTIPLGFTGSVKSVASKEKTYVVGSKNSPSQAQTVTLTPGTGRINYNHPSYGRYVKPKDLRNLNTANDNDNRYVSVSKSVTRALDGENNIKKQYSHTYYTKSSSCGYFTFTCTMVSSAEGRKKVCKPKIPTNPDGTPIRC